VGDHRRITGDTTAEQLHGELVREVRAAGHIPAPDGGSTVPVRGPALADGSSPAFFTHRRLGTEAGTRSELGAIGFGPSGAGLAQVITHHIQAWDTARDVRPRLAAYPAGTPDDALPEGAVIEKRHTRLVVTYPPSPHERTSRS
jgi:protein-L-isoaspartate(D-aspartate) O-methyltransferase